MEKTKRGQIKVKTLDSTLALNFLFNINHRGRIYTGRIVICMQL